MAQLVSSFESIRQTLNNSQFDACENLLRDLLINEEVDHEARPFLKEILSSVVARRALDHARNFVARGNIEAAHRIMHRAWHQLENEGLDDVSSHARSAITRAASDSELEGFSADHLAEIINAYLGVEHFDELLGSLPHSAPAQIARDRATRVVKAAEIKPIATRTSSVVMERDAGSVGKAILKSMLRLRVVVVAILVFIIVAVVGYTTRSESYRTEFMLLRPTSTGDDAYSAKVRSLPKATLQGMPTQNEVLNDVSNTLLDRITDETTRRQVTPSGLKGMISASVASGDYGSTDSTLKIVFEAPNKEIAEEGSVILRDKIIQRHNTIVTADLSTAVKQLKATHEKLEEENRRLAAELQGLTKDSLIPSGNRDQQRNALLKMLSETRHGYYNAAASAASSSVRSTEITRSRQELPEEVTWSTDTPGTAALMLQPLYMQLNADKQRAQRLRSKAEAANLGEAHPTFLELKDLERAIKDQEEWLNNERIKVEGTRHTSRMTRGNQVHEAIDIQARISAADQMAAAEAKKEWQKALDKIVAELHALDSGDSRVPKLTDSIIANSQKQGELNSDIIDLQIFAAREPGGLAVISDVNVPEIKKSSPVKLFLAALGLAFLAAIIASFTGGQRAVHIVVLGIISTLVHFR